MSRAVAILGATGLVGRTTLRILEERGFPLDELRLLASERSADRVMSFRGRDVAVRPVAADAFAGVALLLTSAFSGCGGGGGGSGGGSNPPPPVVYSGNQNAAVVSADSARTLAAAAIGSSAASVLIAGIEIQQQQPAPTSGPVALAPRLNRYLRSALQRVLGRANLLARITGAFNVQETDNCDVSGTVTFSGTLSDTTGTGTLSVVFAACNLGSGVLNGPATFRIDANDIPTGFPTDSTTSFSILQVKTFTTVNW